MNSPNYPPPGGPQGPYGPPQGQPYGQRPPQTPPGGQPYGGPPPQGQGFGGPPPQGQGFGGGPGGPGGGPGGGFGSGPGGPGGPSGPGGAPPAAYPTPPPPAPTGKPKNTGTIIKVVVGIIVIAVGAVVYFVTRGSDPAASNVGDCIKVNNAASADLERVECNSPDATYKVAFTSGNASGDCPGGDESSYVSYTETRSRGSDTLLCLILNVKEGDCLEQGTQADTIVECTDPKATYKVIKVLTGTVDPAGCPEETVDGYIYKEPATVQCFGDAKAGQT